MVCPWDSPGKYTEVDCHSLLQGIIPDPGIELAATLQADASLPSELPRTMGKVTKRKDIIKIRGNRDLKIEKNQEPFFFLFFERVDKIDKPLVRPI